MTITIGSTVKATGLLEFGGNWLQGPLNLIRRNENGVSVVYVDLCWALDSWLKKRADGKLVHLTCDRILGSFKIEIFEKETDGFDLYTLTYMTDQSVRTKKKNTVEGDDHCELRLRRALGALSGREFQFEMSATKFSIKPTPDEALYANKVEVHPFTGIGRLSPETVKEVCKHNGSDCTFLMEARGPGGTKSECHRSATDNCECLRRGNRVANCYPTLTEQKK